MTETPAQPRRAIVIHSPFSGKSELRTQALELLRQNSIDIIDSLSIATLDGLPAQGAHWQEQGIDIAIAAGGDGLVGGVITHIAESGLPLGILPLGTANDIARSVGIPQNVTQAVDTLVHGTIIQIDIGKAYPAEQAPLSSDSPSSPKSALQPSHSVLVPSSGYSYFAHALTIGLNVQFARVATNIATRRQFGSMTYPFAALELLKNYEAVDVDLRFDGLALFSSPDVPSSSPSGPPARAIAQEPITIHCRALQVTVINAPVFGGAWEITLPGSTLQDRLLDIVVFEDIDFERFTMAVSQLFNPQAQLTPNKPIWPERHPAIAAAELTGIPGMYHVQAQGITIATSADPQDVTLDGELRGQTPITTSIANQRLHVIVPK